MDTLGLGDRDGLGRHPLLGQSPPERKELPFMFRRQNNRHPMLQVLGDRSRFRVVKTEGSADFPPTKPVGIAGGNLSRL